MQKIKLEHIDNLSRGKKSWANIGSRLTPHHLYKYEQEKYQRALKYKYLEITTKDRINLKNIWDKVCQAQKWENYILIKDAQTGQAEVYKNNSQMFIGDTNMAKKHIKSYLNPTSSSNSL